MKMLLPPVILMSPRLFIIRGQYGKDFLAPPGHVVSLSTYILLLLLWVPQMSKLP